MRGLGFPAKNSRHDAATTQANRYEEALYDLDSISEDRFM